MNQNRLIGARGAPTSFAFAQISRSWRTGAGLAGLSAPQVRSIGPFALANEDRLLPRLSTLAQVLWAGASCTRLAAPRVVGAGRDAFAKAVVEGSRVLLLRVGLLLLLRKRCCLGATLA
jgi:hypothetical protein